MKRTIEQELQDINAAREIVEKKFNTKLISKDRKREGVDARMVYAKLLREMGLSYKRIGDTLGKDHSSIVHYNQAFDKLLEFNDDIKVIYAECVNEYFNGREPVIAMPEIAMRKELIELRKKINVLTIEQDKILDMQLKYERLKSIIELVNSRTPRGKERLIERKINLMFNGLENSED